MKKIFCNVFGISIFLLMCAGNSVAGTYRNVTDTIRKQLTASLDKKMEAVSVVLKEANIIYPDILVGNEAQSIEYVEKFSTNRKQYLIRTYNRSKNLFPKVAAILQKHQVPEEFKVLLALESGFNGNAVSSAGAVGYWQIMDEVAKEYGLKIPRKVMVEEKSKVKHASKSKKNNC